MSEADEYGPGGLYADGPNTEDAARDEAYMNVPEDDDERFPNPVQEPIEPPTIDGTEITEEI